MARRLGITTPLEPDYNTMLGGRETYLYEMARAYAVVDADGNNPAGVPGSPWLSAAKPGDVPARIRGSPRLSAAKPGD